MKRVQIHGRPREDTLDEKDGMVAPRISVRRAHKAPRMKAPFNIPFDVENGKHDLLRHLIAQEIYLIREDIEITLKEETKKEIEKQKTKLYASLKTELLEEMRKDIISHVKKSHLEVKDGMTQYLKDEISSRLS